MTHASTTEGIIRDWICKAENERDIFNKFICFWISFNCYYAKITKKNGDTQALEKLYSIPEIIEIFNMIKKESVFNTAPLELKKQMPLKDMRIGHNNKVKELNGFSIKNVIDVLYQARCNLFHGDKSGNSDRDREVISACIPVLKIVLLAFYKGYPPEM